MAHEKLPLSALTAVSSIDGRYRDTAATLAPYFSEFALIRYRVLVECRYLIALSEVRGFPLRAFTAKEKKLLLEIANISLEDAKIIKTIEREGYQGIPATNHDVKAVEYFIKLRLQGTSLADILEFVHILLTSEDINSVAYALGLRDALEEVTLPALETIEKTLGSLSKKHAKLAMLARTHGQPATPTTFGKEMKVFAARLQRQIDALVKQTVLVKWGGATGNYNAHVLAAPAVNWTTFAQRFVAKFNERAGGKKRPVRLVLNTVTTQIEPHDSFAELFDGLRRANTILIDLTQDMWRYISDNWVVQKPKEGEVGSSAMPHKVNPIDFENAEGNLGVANALLEHFSRKLPISRLQRDLSDSTVQRVFGTAFAFSLIGYRALSRGFGKVAPSTQVMLEVLLDHPEVLAEAIQSVLRVAGVETPYEKLKLLTRGKRVTLKELHAFVDSLDISKEAKKRLRSLRPDTYIGIAGQIARQ